MFRGTLIRNKLWVTGLLSILAFGGLSPAEALAQSQGRLGDAVSSKMAAPTQEDHAAYFSENRKEVSKTDLQKADGLRLKTINSIKDLVSSKKKSVRRFELLLRLGEIHVERHDYLRDLDTETYAKAFESWSKTKKGTEPKPNFNRSEAELTNAANAFRQLVNEFPKHPRTDAALYSLARTLGRMNKETSVDYYKQLIKSFPKSPLIPDTYLSLGEYYFDKHNIDAALENYKKVLDFKENRVYPFAVYKLGWAYYNASAKNDKETADNYKKAVTAFKLVVKLAERDKKAGKKSNFDLREEAIRDLIMVWADSEEVDTAWAYFKTIGEQDSFYKMLERLGHIYFEQGKNTQSIAVFQRLLKESPRRGNNPTVHAKLVELYDLTNNTQNVVVEIQKMHTLYLGDTVWAKANAKDKAGVDEATLLAENTTHRYGALFHQRGQKSKSEAYLKSSSEIYKMYLSSFPKSTNAYEIRYYLAEILFDFKQYDQASDHYLVVAKSDPSGKYHKTSALNAVAAMNQVVFATKWPTLPPAGQVASPMEIPAQKKKLIATIDQYIGLLPKEKEGDPMRFTAAQTYFDYGHYDDAIKRFYKVTTDIPESKQAKSAVRLILGFHSEKQDWDSLISWSQRFAKADKVLDNDLRKFVVDVLRGAMFKKALVQEKAGKFEAAALAFVEYQKEFPSDANADRALYNAMLNYFKVGRVENAVTVGNQILEKYPKSETVSDVLANLGMTHESLARFDEAASMYKRLAQTFPADKRAAGALFNAAILYKGTGKVEDSIALLTDFNRRWPTHELSGDVSIELASLLEKSGRMVDAAKVYEDMARRAGNKPDLVLLAQAKVAVAKASTQNAEASWKDMEKVANTLSAKGAPVAYEARNILAAGMFKLVEPDFAAFMAIKVTDGAKIEKQVAAKQNKLEVVADRFSKIIEIGSAEYVVAAMYRLGEAHENFANSLFKAPSPQGASQSDVDKFKTELEKVAFPLREEAYKFFETAYKRSKEVDTFTVWTRRTFQKMVDLSPDKHQEIDELSADPAYLSHDVKLIPAVAELIND